MEGTEKTKSQLLKEIALLKEKNSKYKAAEKALIKSEEKYHDTIQNLTEGYYSATLDGILLDYNIEFLKVAGLKPNKNYKGTLLQDFWKNPKDRKVYLDELIKNGSIKNYEIKSKKSDGTPMTALINARIIKDNVGNIVSIEGTLLDITERKKNEEELRRQAEAISAIVDTSQDWIWSINIQGIHTYSNKAIDRILGYSDDELVGKNSMELMHDEDRQKVEAKFPFWISEKQGWKELILRWKHKDGSWRHLESSSVPIIDRDGTVLGFRGVDRDVTERIKAKEALQESEKRFRFLAENAHDMIYRMSLPNGIYEYVSPAATKIFGYNPDEFINNPLLIQKIIHPDWHKYFEEQWELLLVGKVPPTYEYQIVHGKSGETRWLNQRNVLIQDNEGKSIALEGIVTDITERKVAEIALQSIATQFSAISGIKFFEKVCEHLSKTLQIDYAFVGELKENEKKVKVISGIGKGDPLEQFEYELANTPCENVIGQSICFYSSGVQKLFPKDDLLIEMGIEGYIGIPLFDRSGKALGIMVLLNSSPITNDKNATSLLQIFSARVAAEIERMQAEEALLESEEKYRNLVEQANDGICILQDNHVKFANKCLADMWGGSVEEIINTPFTNYIHPDEKSKLADYYTRRLANENVPSRFEIVLKHISGSNVNAELSAEVIKYMGKPANLVIIRDITERKKSEVEIRKLSTAVEQSPSVIVITDLKGIIEYVNPKFTKLAGYSTKEILGKTTSILKSGSQSDDIYKELWKRISSGKEWRGEFHNKKKNGELFWEAASISPIFDKLGNITNYLKVAEDITERKKAEEELINSEERLKILFESAPDAYYLVDLKGIFIDGNKAAEKLMGYKKEELIGKSFFKLKLLSVKELIKASKLLLKNIQGKGTGPDQFTLNRKNGSQIPVEISTYPVKIKGKTVVLGIARDITEREKAGQLLKDSEYLLRESQKVAVLGSYILDITNGSWKSSPVLDDIFGIDKKYIKNIDAWVKFVHTDDRDMIQDYFATNVLTNHEAFNKVYRIKRINDNQVRWVHGLGKLEFNDEGNPIKMIGTIQDITERKQVEDTLALHRQRLTYILEGTNAGTWDWNVQTGELTLNDRWAEIMGYTLQELEPIDINVWIDNVHPDDLPFANALLESHFKQETDYYDTDFRQPHKDGGWVWVNARGKVIQWTKDGKPLRMSGTHIDITERKQADENLKLALEKANESDRLKSAFLATMSHELRTPLNAIIGFSDIINKEIPIDDIVNYADTINKSGNHLLSIVEELFDLTLIESGEIKIVKEEINIQNILAVIQKILTVEQQKTKKDHIALNLITPNDGKELIINSDSSKLKQIFINLLKNALKFTKIGHVNYGYKIKKNRNKSIILFFVEDTGIGIPENKIEFIFDVFRQVDDSYTRQYGGTGIGLSICKKLIGFLGGDIWVESEEGKGSTFYFTIPYDGKQLIDEATTITTKVKTEISIDTKTILIVEDIETSYEFLKTILQISGYKSLWAINGKEAVSCCKENTNIDLVLMDINMPKMNGYDATRAIKEFRPELPIIAQTAYAILGDREKSIEAGCDDYISKPIKQKVLIEILKKYLS